MQIMDPEDDESREAPRWLASISALLIEDGWRAAYRDGTGRSGHAAARARLQDRRETPASTSGTYLGPKANVTDAERAGILTAHRMAADKA